MNFSFSGESRLHFSPTSFKCKSLIKYFVLSEAANVLWSIVVLHCSVFLQSLYKNHSHGDLHLLVS